MGILGLSEVRECKRTCVLKTEAVLQLCFFQGLGLVACRIHKFPCNHVVRRQDANLELTATEAKCACFTVTS